LKRIYHDISVVATAQSPHDYTPNKTSILSTPSTDVLMFAGEVKSITNTPEDIASEAKLL